MKCLRGPIFYILRARGSNAHPCSPSFTSLVVPTLDLVQRQTQKFLKEQTNKCCEALTSRLPRFRIQGSQALYKRVRAALLRNWRFCVCVPSSSFSDNSVQVFYITRKRIAFSRCKSEVNCKPHVASVHFTKATAPTSKRLSNNSWIIFLWRRQDTTFLTVHCVMFSLISFDDCS